MFSLTSDGWCYVTVGFLRKGECGSWCRDVCTSLLAPVTVLRLDNFISLQPSAVSSCFLICCTYFLAGPQIPPSMESSPQQFSTNYFCARSKIPPLRSTALCFTKPDSGPHPFHNPIFISIKVHSFHFIAVAQKMFYRSSIVCPFPYSFLWQHFADCSNH